MSDEPGREHGLLEAMCDLVLLLVQTRALDGLSTEVRHRGKHTRTNAPIVFPPTLSGPAYADRADPPKLEAVAGNLFSRSARVAMPTDATSRNALPVTYPPSTGIEGSQ
jgi:hypothetical protein